jgi:hypothetical protein
MWNRIPFATAAVFLLMACASAPLPPSEALRAAEQAITTADQDRVADYASPELSEARQKLTAARKAVTEENMVAAARLAQQAKLDADLASAKAGAARALAVNEETRESIDVLKQEMQRNSGVRP